MYGTALSDAVAAWQGADYHHTGGTEMQVLTTGDGSNAY